MQSYTETQTLALIPLRGLTVFPNMVLSFDAGRNKTVAALEEALETNQTCILVSQRDPRQNRSGAGGYL